MRGEGPFRVSTGSSKELAGLPMAWFMYRVGVARASCRVMASGQEAWMQLAARAANLSRLLTRSCSTVRQSALRVKVSSTSSGPQASSEAVTPRTAKVS